MASAENGPLFPGGAIIHVDTDDHGTSTISFPVDEDGQIHPNPESEEPLQEEAQDKNAE